MPIRFVAALLLLLIGTPAFGQSGRVYVTELGRRVLTRSDQVVEGKVAKVMPPFRGITTARIAVTTRLSGFDRAASLVVLFIDDYTAPDAFNATLENATVRYERSRKAGLARYLDERGRMRQPPEEESAASGPNVKRAKDRATGATRREGVGVRLTEGQEGVFFLKRKGASYSMVGFFPSRDPLYASKRDRLEDILRIEQIRVFDTRVGNAKRYFFENLASTNPWDRGNAARELGALAVRYPNAFSKKEGSRLARLLFEEKEPPIRWSLERAVRSLDPAAALEYARHAEAAAAQRHADALGEEAKILATTRMAELRAAEIVRVARSYGRAATALVARYLEDPDAIVRERAAQALAEQGGPSALGPLRTALEKEKDPDAAMALIYACGVRADPKSVPLLRKRLEDKRMERAAVHALARVGTPAARKALEAHRPMADAATQDLIDALVREEFAKQS